MIRRLRHTVRDAWEEASFAREWTLGGGVQRTNPDRVRFQHMLGALCKRRLAATGTVGEGILDLGCGSGLSARAIVDAVGSEFRLAGVDGSAAMLELAAEICPEMQTAQLRFGAASSAATDLLYGKGPFRAVVSSQVLHELDLPAKNEAVKVARSALAPGGCFYVADRFLKDLEPGVPADDYEAVWEVLTSGQADTVPWEEYSSYIQNKLDDATTEEACVALLAEQFDQVEVLYRAFNRSLIVARVAS